MFIFCVHMFNFCTPRDQKSIQKYDVLNKENYLTIVSESKARYVVYHFSLTRWKWFSDLSSQTLRFEIKFKSGLGHRLSAYIFNVFHLPQLRGMLSSELTYAYKRYAYIKRV